MKRKIHRPKPGPDLVHLEGHRRPVTRRQFLSRGMVSGGAMLALPSVLSLFGGARSAAAACGAGGLGGAKIPYIGFDLAGGANIASSNVLVGGTGGQLDFLSADAYEKMGLPDSMLPSMDGQVVEDLGLRFHVDSAFYRGIKSKVSDDTALRINGCVFCARSDNDTNQNPHNPIYGVAAAGATGALVELVGTENSESGGNSMAPPMMVDPSLRPTRISSPRDSRGLVDTGKLVQLLSQEDAASVMAASELITDLKIAKINESTETNEIVACAYEQTTDLVANFGDPDALDPSLDPVIVGGASPILTAEDFDNRKISRTASVMKLVANGYAGAGTIELGGYDYHNSTRATGELADFEAGQCMGASLEYAARIGQPLILYVFSDGSVASNGNIDGSNDGRDKGVWTGDNSSTAAVFMLAYSPTDRPILTAQAGIGNQMGHFTSEGSVATDANRYADEVGTLAEVIVLNYMALNGDAGNFEPLFPTQSLGTGLDLNQFIAFESIV